MSSERLPGSAESCCLLTRPRYSHRRIVPKPATAVRATPAGVVVAATTSMGQHDRAGRGGVMARTTSDIIIDAPAGPIMDVIADFGAYPDWATGVKTADIVAGAEG